MNISGCCIRAGGGIVVGWNAQANDIFLEALELDSPQCRSDYLDRACATDKDLRARVERLLAADSNAAHFLESPAFPADLVSLDVPIIEGSGDVIGRYKLLQQIGEGGMGLVFMAEQISPVRRTVALKICKPGMDSKRVIARFEAERQALAMMDHPGIARVLDAGTTATGRCYFVMDLVRGIPVTEYCDQNNLPTAKRLDLFLEICRAIQHAHQKGIIHRDIKPSNILVTLHDGVPVPRVIDFGIAKATDQRRLTDKTLFTQFEAMIGTPAYMSPEQAEMSGLDIDTRTDIYALGVLLYELLTGTTPLDPKELAAGGLDAMRRSIRENEPARPSTRLATMLDDLLTTTARRRQSEPPKLINLLRGDLDWIVMKCLEKDRTRRYETANALAMDIDRYLSNEPVLACPPSGLYRFRKLVRRNRGTFAAAAAVAIALIVGLAVSTFLFIKEKHTRQRAVIAEIESREVAQFLKDMLQGVGPSKALGRDTTMLREVLDQTAHRLDAMKAQPAVEANLRSTLGNVYADLGDYPDAAQMHRQALLLRKNSLGDAHPDVAQSLNDLAQVLYLQGNYPDAESLHRQALALRKQLFGNQSLEVATSLHNLAETLRRERQPQTLAEADGLFREALAMRRKLLGEENKDVADSLHGLAMLLWGRGQYTDAEAGFRDALAMRRKLFGPEHPDVAKSLDRLGMTLHAENKFPDAEEVLTQAIAMQHKLFGEEHPDLAHSIYHLAEVKFAQNQTAEAEPLLLKVIAMRRKLLGNDHPDVADALLRLNLAFNRDHQYEQAEAAAREALRIRKKLGNTGGFISDPLIKLLRVLTAQRKFDEAKSICRNEMASADAVVLNELAWAWVTGRDTHTRDGVLAVELAEKAVAMTNRQNANFLDTLAAAYAETGQFDKAVSVETEAIAGAHDEKQKTIFEAHLKLYQAKMPYRAPN